MDLTSITNDKVCSFLASQIRSERLRQGYSQAVMAEKSGIPLRTYKRIESNGMGSIQNLIIILRALERIMALKLLFPLHNMKPRTTIIARVQKIAENSRQK
ncbi:MAG: helix-turn-helix transcriptional regulator [Sideroxyarcus sp.]|nr:helix-turn-helix transcriptional regulator [Sideroxyarcus sp.]